MDVAEIREQIPGLRFGVYLNTGGVGQAPASVSQAITAGYRPMADGRLSPIDWYEAMSKAASEIPAKIADFFGADSTEIALTMSTGDGFGMVLGGLCWESGDEVLITSEEHPVPLQAVQGLADREGAVIKEVELDHDKDVILERVERAITPRTRLICFSHVTTDSGTLLPAEEICALARARGILTLWDGCQAVGQLPVDLHGMGCDFYATNCYKWLLAPIGTGFVRRGAQQALKPLRRPHDPSASARQYEMGSPASVLYLGVGASFDFLTCIGGPRAITAEVSRKAEELWSRLDAIPERHRHICHRRDGGRRGLHCPQAALADRPTGHVHDQSDWRADLGGLLHQRRGAGHASRSGDNAGRRGEAIDANRQTRRVLCSDAAHLSLAHGVWGRRRHPLGTRQADQRRARSLVGEHSLLRAHLSQ